MAWEPPTFDVTGKSYTVDPAPVTDLIRQGTDLQRDSLRNLAGVVQAGLDVHSKMMARRQLSELKVKIADLDPASDDYPAVRANLLASNPMAFTDPNTKGIASEIVKGYDQAREDKVKSDQYLTKLAIEESYKQANMGAQSQALDARAANAADEYMKRLALGESYHRERLGIAGQLQKERDAEKARLAVRPGSGRLGAYYGSQGAPADASGQSTAAGPPADYGLNGADAISPEPDLPSAPAGPPDATLLSPGDYLPGPLDETAPSPAGPQTPAPPVSTPAAAPATAPSGPGSIAPSYELDSSELNPVGEGQTWTFPTDTTPVTAAATATLANHPGFQKAEKLSIIKGFLDSASKNEAPEDVIRARRDVAALQVDPDVRDFLARKAADEKIRLRELTTQAKAPAETATERKDRVALAVDYELAADKAALEQSKRAAADLRSASRKKSPPDNIEAQLAAADARVSQQEALFIRKNAATAAQWDSALRKDPDAFRKALEVESETAKKNAYLEKEFGRIINANSGSGDDDLEGAAPSSPASPSDAAWRGIQQSFDANVGQATLTRAVNEAIQKDGSIDKEKVEHALELAYTDPQGKKYPNANLGSIGKVPRPWYTTDDVSLRQFISERADDLIRTHNQQKGGVDKKVLDTNPGFRLSVKKIP